jgi:hypothetical protein
MTIQGTNTQDPHLLTFADAPDPDCPVFRCYWIFLHPGTVVPASSPRGAQKRTSLAVELAEATRRVAAQNDEHPPVPWRHGL